MPLKRIRSRRPIYLRGAVTEPLKVRRHRQLVAFSKHPNMGMRCNAADPVNVFLRENGYILIVRTQYRIPGAAFRPGQQTATVGKITEAGWTALFEEHDLGAARPVPKSERREKRTRHV